MSATEPLLPASSSFTLHDGVGRSALRKASWRILPLLAVGYGVAYMDRVNISFAALQMNRDLHFSASVYGFGAGLFFVSYAACEVPSNLLLFRVGARRWFARIMLTWGLLAMAMMFVKTPLQFYVMRFLLGVAEAGFFPGVLFYLAQWFPPHMRARAISRFYMSLPLSSVFMGAIAGSLLDLQGKAGLAGWQWLFLLEGLPAVALSIVLLVWLPSNPQQVTWLTAEERHWLLHHLDTHATEEHGGIVGRALLDCRVWQIGLVLLCQLTCTYAYLLSAPAILKSMTGFSNRHVGYLVSAMSLLGAPAMILGAIHSDRKKERYFHVVVPFLLMSACFLIVGLTRHAWLGVPALTLAMLSYYSLQGPILALASSFLHGRYNAAGIAAMNTIGMLGGFIGPWGMGLAKDFTGSYQPGLLLLVIPTLVAATTVWMMRSQARAKEPSEAN